MANALEIRDVAKRFGALAALDGVSIELHEREILGLLGPNGAGKSTLVRAIMGRVRPDAGTIAVSGKVVSPDDADSRSVIGFVPQEIALYPLLTAEENFRVFGRYLGLRGAALRDAIEWALDWAALADRRRSRTEELSGGMKRRLNMAAGVLHRPKILLLDEPTVGVDPQSRQRIYEMIEALRDSGTSMIYTTHYMDEAERLCDRVAVIDRGRVIAVGTREELVRATIGSGREVIVECASPLSDHLLGLLGATPAAVDGARIRFVTEEPASQIAKVLHLLEREGMAVHDLRLEQPTLERVFLHLTGRELRE